MICVIGFVSILFVRRYRNSSNSWVPQVCQNVEHFIPGSVIIFSGWLEWYWASYSLPGLVLIDSEIDEAVINHKLMSLLANCCSPAMFSCIPLPWKSNTRFIMNIPPNGVFVTRPVRNVITVLIFEGRGYVYLIMYILSAWTPDMSVSNLVFYWRNCPHLSDWEGEDCCHWHVIIHHSLASSIVLSLHIGSVWKVCLIFV